MPAQKRKVRVDTMVRLDAYKVLSDAVERGVRYGYRRAHKHVDAPDEDALCDAIEQAVLSDLCEVLVFDEP